MSNSALSALYKGRGDRREFQIDKAQNVSVFIDFKHDQSYELIGKGILKLNEVQAEII